MQDKLTVRTRIKENKKRFRSNGRFQNGYKQFRKSRECRI